jgi:formylglycine-generating enzyme required for sulfatase activity
MVLRIGFIALLFFSLALSLGSTRSEFGGQAAPNIGDKIIANSIGMKLALIPPGKFIMGSPLSEKDRDPDELQHEVIISKPFYLGIYEVTQAEYEKVTGKNPSFFNRKAGGGPDFPVDQVEFPEAEDFCRRLSQFAAEKEAGRVYRLPTEAEWEYACRAGATTSYHCGDALSSKEANIDGRMSYGGATAGAGGGEKNNFLGKTVKVGSYPPNGFGLYDMHGNVAEWCSDFYDEHYYSASPKEDPKGPAKGVLPTGFGAFYRVVRGGCWLDDARTCRSAYRFRYMPSDRYRLVGFRVACDINLKSK